jgi:hypothetical protein
MGDLRDMLLKAGLVSEEQAKKAEEEARQAPRGGAGGGGRKKGGPRPHQGGAGNDRGGGQRGERDAPEARAEPAAERSPKDAKRLLEVAHKGKVDGKTRGQRRWYYVSRKGSVPYLELSDERVKELEQGQVAIAETDRGDAWLVTRACAEELAAIDPSWVRSG